LSTRIFRYFAADMNTRFKKIILMDRLTFTLRMSYMWQAKRIDVTWRP